MLKARSSCRSILTPFELTKYGLGDLVIFSQGTTKVGRIVAVETDIGALYVCRYAGDETAVAGVAVGLIRRA